MDELKEAVKGMARNKSPGTSGFQTDFYVVFWMWLCNMYHQAVLYAFEVGKFSTSMREGLISLIPKKSVDTKFLKNWRPIVLLNTGYKIVSKAIANRMKLVLHELIHEDQTAYIKGRNISENIRRTIDIMQYAFMSRIDAVVVTIDFLKAFDRVEFNFGLILEKLFDR